jgi:cathepsin L
MDLNKFTDMSTKSISGKYNLKENKKLWQNINRKINSKKDFFVFNVPTYFNNSSRAKSCLSDADQEDSVDWRLSRVLTNVSDQQDCGSCWAFSAIGALESHSAIHNGILNKFSVQQLVDCSLENFGCNGGTLDNAFNYIVDTKNIVYERKYPYMGVQQTCNTKIIADESNYPDLSSYPSSWAYVSGESTEYLKYVLKIFGPVSIAIEVKNNLYFYNSGVYDDYTCTKEGINHAVLLVGYGYDMKINKNYWIIKNSWGEDWGEDGYFRILLDDKNICGVLSYPFIPLFK